MLGIQGSLVRKVALAGLIAFCSAQTAFAQTTAPSTGLGQSWPNAADLSASSRWHVYTFVRDGIKYIQINDLSGAVHAAVATAKGVTIVLPIGSDAENVVSKPAPRNLAQNGSAQIIYRDKTSTITAVPSNGPTRFYVAAICTSPYECSTLSSSPSTNSTNP